MYPGSSLGEQLQLVLPQTRVFKTLNTMMFKARTDPRSLVTPPTAFLSGNDPSAKVSVRALLDELGWPEAWGLDLGDISTARGAEKVFLFLPYLARILGFVPFALSVAH
ncbi:hypothetical protein [Deinococcus ruber]|uniref:Uncharacterized protein n=1 Tax=Deinococcus ruber TaxID=1848197 RepID=A0A918KXK5_9DEIO|nr:hypothetical protein [Deinococcus ruber]GGR40812.1 hypothetical protein GCM10008957_56400 [Deinococcus ruber]